TLRPAAHRFAQDGRSLAHGRVRWRELGSWCEPAAAIATMPPTGRGPTPPSKGPIWPTFQLVRIPAEPDSHSGGRRTAFRLISDSFQHGAGLSDMYQEHHGRSSAPRGSLGCPGGG